MTIGPAIDSKARLLTRARGYQRAPTTPAERHADGGQTAAQAHPPVKSLHQGQTKCDLVPRRHYMGFIDKVRNRFKMGQGRVRQNVGRATGDPYQETRGQAERVDGATRQVGEQVKDAGKNVKDAFRK